MSSPDGWTEGEGDLPFLPKQDGFDGVRRFFDDLLHRDMYGTGGTEEPRGLLGHSEPTYHVICCVCRGEGRITEVFEGVNFFTETPQMGTLNDTCPACDGAGSVGMVRERKGTR